jgi:hypothetical protein
MSLRYKQRRDAITFADGLDEMLRGADTLPAEAARLNVAELLLICGNYMTDGKWSK